MRRAFIEAGLAAIIFFAANAVFGLDALIARSLPKVIDSAMALMPESMRLQLSEIGNMRLPSPIDVDMDKAGIDRVFCLQPQFGTRPVKPHLPDRPVALTANDSIVPYSLSVDLNDTGHAMAGTLTTGSCHGGGNVNVRVKVSKHALDALEHVAATDTVTLYLDSE